MSPNKNVFVHPREVWSNDECVKRSRRTVVDGMGTKESRPGRINGSASSQPGYGQTVIYNGGCTRNGKWYDGESIPYPKLPNGWEIKRVPSWGDYLVKTVK